MDDDVIVDNNYLEKTINLLADENVVGVSGLAISINRKIKSIGFVNYLKRIFLLDSKLKGTVTKSGINVPVLDSSPLDSKVDVRWLIGCSVWNYSKIHNLKFENRFDGQSLFEDVIFSLKASREGRLIVDPSIRLTHLESAIERPDHRTFYKMWIFNRYFVINELNLNAFEKLFFHWTNLGKTMQLCASIPISPLKNLEKILGVILGYGQLMKYLLFND